MALGGSIPLIGAGGGGGGETFVSQELFLRIGSFSRTVPENAKWCFREVLGHGGFGQSYYGGGGGGGDDDIIEVTPGDSISVVIGQTRQGYSENTYIVYNGDRIDGHYGVDGTTSTGGAGKYPGTSGPYNSGGGEGGGRLAGKKRIGFTYGGGPGSGAVGHQNTTQPSSGAACLTYFTTYEAALAFANSQYGGAWTP